MKDTKNTKQEVSEVVAGFLNYVDQVKAEYQAAYEAEGVEDKRLQDLLHAVEFAEGEEEDRCANIKLKQSRRERRKQKDEVKRLKLIVEFWNEPENKKTLNRLRQMLGKQRKTEEYLNSERVYKPRMEGQE